MKRSILILLCFLITGCTAINPTTQAQSLLRKGNFEGAIEFLEKEHKANPDSVPIKSLLAQTYSDYGLIICQDADRLPKDKYPLAKKKFQKALALNPYLKEAEDMVRMIEKIEAEFNKTANIKTAEDLNDIKDEIAKAKAEEKLKELKNEQ